MKFQLLIALFALPAGFANAQVSVYEGTPGRPGNVVVVAHAAELRPTELQQIVLLPVDCTGRTRLTELLDGRARQRTDVPGAARVLLPGERGSIYKYRRDEPGGGATFGYFLVRPSGIATSLFELGGTGPTGDVDPLPANLAVADDGRAFLVASSKEAGGDLWEVSLLGTAINRTPNLAPRDFKKNGLVLLGDWGLGVAGDGVQRFDRTLGGTVRLVNLPILSRWFGPDVVRSADESTVAFLAGDDATRALVLSCRRSGDAVLASDKPMNIPNAGFLPDDPAGPGLALSTNGSWVAWRSTGVTRECFVRETRPGTRAPSQHVTGNPHFDDTLNDTGVIAFFDHDSAVLAAGRDRNDGIGRGDLYRIDLASPSGFTVTNLTRTSGLTQPPFDYGTLSTGDGLFQVPGLTPSFVLLDRAVTAGRMLWVDATGGTFEFLDRVQSLDSLDVAGSFLVAGVTRPPGVDDPSSDSLNLVQIPAGGLGATVVRLPDGCHLSRTVGSRSRNVFAAVLGFQVGERLGRLHVPSPRGMAVSPLLLTFGPTTGLSAEGAILATVKLTRDRAAFSWSDVSTEILRMTRGESFLLPGL
jgi:hypothetical protein